ncbi:EthD domain-containing protein [Podospora didyma]|uniref:EthD domain-containing protein n=1 Tax=Podospora didyma TaxID=330526 RepID=A0AAE0P3V5_9PEZI|nr:EthD domain-containing protein [Podospora didyma]
MTFTILIITTRKAGLSPAEFRNEVERIIIPFMKELLGENFPLSHTRRYLKRNESPKAEGNTERNPTTPATVFMGTQADFDYDSVSELTFADQAHFSAFIGQMQQPEIAARIGEAEAKAVDVSKNKIVVVGSIETTMKG